MGIHDRMTMMLRYIANARKRVITDEDADKAYADLHPQIVACGIVGIVIALPCPCGEVMSMTSEPIDQSIAELEEMKAGKDEDVAIVDTADTEHPRDEKRPVASNLGSTHTRCPRCGNLYLLAWESLAVKVKKENTIPWEGPEIPDLPSSGPFMPPDPSGNGTVH